MKVLGRVVFTFAVLIFWFLNFSTQRPRWTRDVNLSCWEKIVSWPLRTSLCCQTLLRIQPLPRSKYRSSNLPASSNEKASKACSPCNIPDFICFLINIHQVRQTYSPHANNLSRKSIVSVRARAPDLKQTQTQTHQTRRLLLTGQNLRWTSV